MHPIARPHSRGWLLSGVASGALVMIGSVHLAQAAGGAGGFGSGGGAVAPGGAGFMGAPGTNGSGNSGGGGGGAAGGGKGGNGSSPGGGGGAGGAGGTAANPNGAQGASGPDGGGGGGGGFNGTGALTGDVAGGNGGNGGAGTRSRTVGGGGGGGGGGGYGAILGGDAITNAFTVRGGKGGDGGQAGPISRAGSGGDGGIGIQFTGANATLINSGRIAGGNGGAGGAANGLNSSTGNAGLGGNGIQFSGASTLINTGLIAGGDGGAVGASNNGAPIGTSGAGGVGVVGASLTVVNSGAIRGGLSGDGVTRANAITFTGGVNSLELRSGFSFLGRVVDQTGRGTLVLGGATSAADTTLDAGTIGAGQQYDGFAALQKTGASTWTLVGTNLSRLPTLVQQGTLQIDGALSNAPFTVTGGTLAGTGTVGATAIQAGGTLSPGSAAAPYGTLTVNGPLTFAPGAFYDVRITRARNSRTNVVGPATIAGGTVRVSTSGLGAYASRTPYTILTATGGVSGTFSGVSGSSTFLRPILSYDANDVFLSVQKLAYATAAGTQNQRAVAGGLDNAYLSRPGGDGAKVFAALNKLTVPQARAAFDSLSGEGITAAQNVAFRSTQLFTSSIFDQTTFYAGGGAANSVTLTERLPGIPAFFALAQPQRELADLPASRVEPAAPLPVANRTWRAWANGYGGVENISGRSGIGSAAQRNDIFGGALGVDYQLLPNYLIGVAVGGSNGNFRVDQRGTTGSTTGGHIALYDLFELGNWYGASSSSFSYFGNQTTRFVNGFGGLGTEQNRGNFNSNEFRNRIEIGRHFASLPGLGVLPALTGFGTVTPFVALEIASLRSNGFTETPLKGGPGLFRLNVSGQSAASAPGFVGLRFQRVTPLGNGMVLSPTLQVAYVHEFAPYRNQIGQLSSLPGSTFLVDGARPARDAAQVKAGAELALGPHSAVFANFDGEFARVNQLYAGKGGFRYLW